jgi:dTDP-4-amino-4,6-dideoxygalactose transaminase
MTTVPGNSIVREFEYKIAENCGSKHCLSVSNATVGILGVFYALGLINEEVITTPLTWSGAFSGLQMLNCKITFCDIEPENLTLNPDLIESLITPNTKAVFSSDFLGYPARLDKIKEICTKHNLLLIHDAASSFGSKYKGLYSGIFADVSILSFGANKIFSIGEGGCILSENDEIFEMLNLFLKHPERQSVECENSNPFALNTKINPLAAKYAIENIAMKIGEIKYNQKLIIDWLSKNSTIGINPSDEPNYYRIIAPSDVFDNHNNNYMLSNLPFKSLIFNERGFKESSLTTIPNCPVAEEIIKQKKIITISKWS